MPGVFTLCFGGTPKRKSSKRGRRAEVKKVIPKIFPGESASSSSQKTYAQAVEDAPVDPPPRSLLDNTSLADKDAQTPLLRLACCEDVATQPCETALGGVLGESRTNGSCQGMLQELRDAMIMKVCPAMITIVTYDGMVLHQNPSSRVYYGPRVHSSDNVLSLVFSLEPAKAERMISELNRVGTAGLWKGVVRVPLSLSRAPVTTAVVGPTTPVLEEGDKVAERGAEAKVAAGRSSRAQAGEGVTMDTVGAEQIELAENSAYVSAPAGMAAAAVAAAVTAAATVNASGCNSLCSSQSLARRLTAAAASCNGTGECTAAPNGAQRRTADDGGSMPCSFLDDPRVSRPSVEASGACQRYRVVGGLGPTSSVRQARTSAQRLLSILSSQQCVQQPRPGSATATAPGELVAAGILDSTAHDPLATSTFATLVKGPPSLAAGPSAIPNRTSSLATFGSVGAPASPADSPRPARRPPRRVNSCYVTNLGSGRVSSGTSLCPSAGPSPAPVPASGSRALAFALSLGTSPVLAVQPHLAPGSPAARSQRVRNSLSGFRSGRVSTMSLSRQESTRREFQEQPESQGQAAKAAATAASGAGNSTNNPITSRASRGIASAAAPKAAHDERRSLPGATVAMAAAVLGAAAAAAAKARSQSNGSSRGRFLETFTSLELCPAAAPPAAAGTGCAAATAAADAATDVAAAVGTYSSGGGAGVEGGDGVPYAVQFLDLGLEADKEAAQLWSCIGGAAAASAATAAIAATSKGRLPYATTPGDPTIHASSSMPYASYGMPYVTDTGSEAPTSFAARNSEKSAGALMGPISNAANLRSAAASRFGGVATPPGAPRGGRGRVLPAAAAMAAATSLCAAAPPPGVVEVEPQQPIAIVSDTSLNPSMAPFFLGQIEAIPYSKVYDVQATACPAEPEAPGAAAVVYGQSGGAPGASDKVVAGKLPSSALVIDEMEEGGLRVLSGEESSPVPPQCYPECWHEVWAKAARDPATGADVIVLTQTDVTAKVVAERHLALVMETEHRLVEQLFPRHILQYITEEWTTGEAPPAAEQLVEGGRHGGKCTGGSLRWRPVVRDCNALATWHPEVTLLFADIKGFTPMCKEVEPRQVMTLLNALYSRYDAMLDKYGVYKVETIGDCYFVAGGLIHEDEDGMAAVRDRDSNEDPLHAERVFMFAKAMLSAAREVLMPTTGQPVEIRIGLHTGPVVSGVVGTRMPRFCLFGDTVNTASRMESTGVPGAIHASEDTFSRLRRSEGWEPTGGIEVKGKGRMQTFLWQPPPDVPARPEAQSSQKGSSTSQYVTVKLPLLTQAAPSGPADSRPHAQQAAWSAGLRHMAARGTSTSFDGFTT